MNKLTLFATMMMISNLLSAQWIQQNQFDYPPSEVTYFNSIFFIDGQHGWVIGNNEEQLPDFNNYLTTDGGDTWELSFTLLGNNRINSVFFTDQNKGWTVGEGFEIQHTYNGSAGSLCYWITQQQTGGYGDQLLSQFFLDSLNGWTVGRDESGMGYMSIIFHTTDGGKNWSQQEFYNGDWLSLFDIYFFDPDQGISIGSQSFEGGLILLKTTDGGESWDESTIGNYGVGFKSLSFSFSNEQHGWIAGSYYDANFSPHGIVLHTNNAGTDWIVQITDTIQPFNDITFTDSNTGWIVGDSGTILHTANGGESWEYQESGTTLDLFSLSFVDQSQGWVCGDSCIILHTSNGGITNTTTHVQSSKFEVQSYPNPVSETCTMEFELNKPELVSLHVFNVTGKMVLQTKPKQFQPGEQQIQINMNGKNNGVYFCRLQVGKEIVTKKIIKVK
jgi:photosystem II stability/assembly factor-like uncharacterized protein